MRPVRCLSCLSVCDVRALSPNGWTDQDETWHADRPRPWTHCDRWGSAPLPKRRAEPPNFRPMFIVAKEQDGSIKMPLGTQPPFPKRRRSTPIFGPCLLWPNGWMDQDGTWHGGRPWFSPHCARWGYTAPLSKKGGRATPNFGSRPSDHYFCSVCLSVCLCILFLSRL